MVSVSKWAFHNIDVYGTLHADKLTSLGGLDYDNGGFQGTNIEKITSLGQITSIPSGYNYNFGWFMGCKKLRLVVLPQTLTNLGTYSFAKCTSLESVILNAITPPTLGTGVFSETNNCPIYVPDESVIAYREASGWSAYADRIKPLSEYTE